MRSDLGRTKICPTGQEFHVQSHRKVRLGPLCLDICSNEPAFRGMRYFPATAEADPDARPDFSVNLCNLSLGGPWSVRSLTRLQDRGYRAQRFSMGYYLTDHFGAPAHLLTEAAEQWIFATDFEPILWPFVVKLVLTIYSIQHDLLHLKAAGLAMGDTGSLLVAHGGGGKTLLLTQLCEAGAQFISNTHCLLDGNEMLPVQTALRVRNDVKFGPLIAARHLSEAIKPGEYTVDPICDLGWGRGNSAPARNICLIDYQPGRRIIRDMQRDDLFEYMDQFALALNVYGLKEDVLDFLGGDAGAFAAQTSAMKRRLRTLVDQCRTYYVSCDSTDPDNLHVLRDLLRS